MPAPVSASAGVARPPHPVRGEARTRRMRSACSPASRRARRPPPAPPADRPARRPPPAPPADRPARRPPSAPPADRPPVVLRLLPQLAALPVVPPSAPPADRPPVVLRLLPQLIALPVVLHPLPPADRPARRPPAVSADGKKHFQLWPGFMFFRAVQPKKSLEKCRFLSASHSFKGQNRFTWQNPIRSIGRNPGLCRATRKAPFSAFDSIRAAGI